MTQLTETIIEMKSEYVCEVLDLAQVHMVWTSRHLQEGRHDEGVRAFEKFVTAVRDAAIEMKQIKESIDSRKLTGEAAAEYRVQRDQQGTRRPYGAAA